MLKQISGETWVSRRDRVTKSKLVLSLDYVFGRGTSKGIDLADLDFEYSRRTGRVRSVRKKSTGDLLFTFRPNGSIAPSINGARVLLGRTNRKRSGGSKKGRKYSRPRWTITVIDTVSEVVGQGKTVFCKHVVNCNDSLRAAEDVAVMNEKGDLLAVGKTILSGPFMKQFKRGAAVKVREGVFSTAPAVI